MCDLVEVSRGLTPFRGKFIWLFLFCSSTRDTTTCALSLSCFLGKVSGGSRFSSLQPCFSLLSRVGICLGFSWWRSCLFFFFRRKRLRPRFLFYSIFCFSLCWPLLRRFVHVGWCVTVFVYCRNKRGYRSFTAGVFWIFGNDGIVFSK